jgi:hypothetical protein
VRSKEKEIAEVAARLDALLDGLAQSAAALSAILDRPALPPDDESKERLVTP